MTGRSCWRTQELEYSPNQRHIRIENERGTKIFSDASPFLQVDGRWFIFHEFVELDLDVLKKLDDLK
jgi:hypothetical protein